jgi:hypothetical protein
MLTTAREMPPLFSWTSTPLIPSMAVSSSMTEATQCPQVMPEMLTVVSMIIPSS